MTNQQKQELAYKVMSRVADIVEYPEILEGTELEDVPAEEIEQQLTTWMKQLPGKLWDNRLPQPK